MAMMMRAPAAVKRRMVLFRSRMMVQSRVMDKKPFPWSRAVIRQSEKNPGLPYPPSVSAQNL